MYSNLIVSSPLRRLQIDDTLNSTDTDTTDCTVFSDIVASNQYLNWKKLFQQIYQVIH